jgi:hypothetical protein
MSNEDAVKAAGSTVAPATLNPHEVLLPVKCKTGRTRNFICTMTEAEWFERQSPEYQAKLREARFVAWAEGVDQA